MKKVEQGFIIDRLTDSILNTISGDSFQTEVSTLKMSDLPNLSKISETKSIDFLIQSPPLTEKERKELSEFIKKRKSVSKQGENDQRKVKIKPKKKA